MEKKAIVTEVREFESQNKMIIETKTSKNYFPKVDE